MILRVTTMSHIMNFLLKELTSAIGNTKDTAPGPDKIHYRKFRHLPDRAKKQVLHAFNQL